MTINTTLANKVSIAGGSGASIVYNSKIGNLVYNQDATSAGLGSGGVFATTEKLLGLEANDFSVQG